MKLLIVTDPQIIQSWKPIPFHRSSRDNLYVKNQGKKKKEILHTEKRALPCTVVCNWMCILWLNWEVEFWLQSKMSSKFSLETWKLICFCYQMTLFKIQTIFSALTFSIKVYGHLPPVHHCVIYVLDAVTILAGQFKEKDYSGWFSNSSYLNILCFLLILSSLWG